MKIPDLILGTANWGWTTDKKEAFQLLEKFLETDRREVDAATNYPINRQPQDFRAAEKILAEFVQAHGLQDLKITMKIGSLNNLRTPESNLSKSFVLMVADEYRRIFRENLHAVMVHWDNRTDENEISETLEAFQILKKQGMSAGLSGIAQVEVYAKVLSDLGFGEDFDVQFKHNIFHSDLKKNLLLAKFARRFSVYGINAGGVKIDKNYDSNSTLLARGGQPDALELKLEKIRSLLPELNRTVRPPLKTMNHIGLIFAGLQPEVGAILLGVSSVPQLLETLDFYRNLEVFDYLDCFSRLLEV